MGFLEKVRNGLAEREDLGRGFTGELVLENNVDEIKQRCKKGMVGFVRQQEAGRRHGREKLNDFRAGTRRDVFNIGSKVVEDDQQRRIHSIQISLAGCHQRVNGLRRLVWYYAFRWDK